MDYKREKTCLPTQQRSLNNQRKLKCSCDDQVMNEETPKTQKHLQHKTEDAATQPSSGLQTPKYHGMVYKRNMLTSQKWT